MKRNDLLVWVDLEMTSVADVRVDQIIEIAVVLTDKDLNVVAEGPDIAVHADRAQFERIDPEVRAMHQANGMEEAAVASTVTLEEAQQQALAFLKEHIAPGTAPLCGNSIHMDRHFLKLQMSEFEQYLFYRCIDVSTLKELARRWAPEVYNGATRQKGQSAHRAKDDILQSIEELRYYREHFLR